MSHVRAAMVFCAALVLVLAAWPAAADPYGVGPPNAGYFPDDAGHTYCWGPNFTQSAFRTAASGRMANLESQTSMSRIFVSACSTETDVRFELMSGSNGIRGDYMCESLSGDVCRRARVRFNTTYLTNDINRRKTACHEIGHSAGLTHGGTATDCMLNGAVTVETATYNSHHVGHINSFIACIQNPAC